MRVRTVFVVYLATAICAGAVAVPVARAFVPVQPAPAAASVPAAPVPSTAPPVVHLQVTDQQAPPPPTIHVPADPAAITGPPYLNYFGWALLDRRTGQSTG